MKNSLHQPNNNTQFVISYELLHLLQWILEHDAEKMRKIIGKALNSGLRERMIVTEGDAPHITENMHDAIVDFFSMLETIMIEIMNEQALLKAHEKNLMPALDQIDSHACTSATVRSSLEKATSKLRLEPNANAQDLLFQEILKQWKPSKKAKLH